MVNDVQDNPHSYVSNTQKVHPEMRWTDIADCTNPIYNFLLPDFEKVGISP